MSESVSENQPQEQAEAAALAQTPSPPPASEGNGKAPPSVGEEPVSSTNLAAPNTLTLDVATTQVTPATATEAHAPASLPCLIRPCAIWSSMGAHASGRS